MKPQMKMFFLYHLKELDKKQISGFIVKCCQRTVLRTGGCCSTGCGPCSMPADRGRYPDNDGVQTNRSRKLQRRQNLSVRLGNGEDISKEENGISVNETFNDGSNDIPYYKITPVAVTAENLDEVIIDGGFHTREDVYLNVK